MFVTNEQTGILNIWRHRWRTEWATRPQEAECPYCRTARLVSITGDVAFCACCGKAWPLRDAP